MSAVQTIRFFATWVLGGPLLLLSALWIMHHHWLREHVPSIANGFGVDARVWSLALVGVIFLCVFPAYWSTGILGQHRTVNVAYFFFLPLWFVHLSAWQHRVSSYGHVWREDDQQRITAFVLVAVVVCFGLAGNSGNAVTDLFTGRAQHSDAQLHERYATLSAAASTADRVAHIPLIQDPPRSLYVIDLRDEAFLVNRDYAAWFGLKAVRIDTLSSVEN
jgi:hypothetical protein